MSSQRHGDLTQFPGDYCFNIPEFNEKKGMINVTISNYYECGKCVFKLQHVVKQGQIHVIEYKIHLSFPKCILSE